MHRSTAGTSPGTAGAATDVRQAPVRPDTAATPSLVAAAAATAAAAAVAADAAAAAARAATASPVVQREVRPATPAPSPAETFAAELARHRTERPRAIPMTYRPLATAIVGDRAGARVDRHRITPGPRQGREGRGHDR